MLIALLVILGIFVLGTLLMIAFWFRRYTRRLASEKAEGEPDSPRLPFRWRYVALPLAFFLISAGLAAYFYHLLPDRVAIRFALDGTPGTFSSPGVTIAWTIGSQLLLALLAAGITRVISRMGFLFGSLKDTGIRPERVFLLMGNALALPQFILCFATADIFVYNAYGQHIMPMWLFLVIILGVGTIAITALLAYAFFKALAGRSNQ